MRSAVSLRLLGLTRSSSCLCHRHHAKHCLLTVRHVRLSHSVGEILTRSALRVVTWPCSIIVVLKLFHLCQLMSSLSKSETTGLLSPATACNAATWGSSVVLVARGQEVLGTVLVWARH